MFTGVMMFVGIKNIVVIISNYRSSLKFPRLQHLSDEFVEMNITCKPHTWTRTTLALRGLDPGSYLVCTSCGLVSGHHFRLNEPGLEVLNNNTKLNAVKAQREEWEVTRTQEILNADFEFWTKTYLKHFGFSAAEDLELLRQFSKFTVESVNDATHRALRESKEKFK
jgi:hypothetical protein